MKHKISFNTEALFWMTNQDWFYIDEETRRFVMKDDAPAKAKISFEVWSGKRKPKHKARTQAKLGKIQLSYKHNEGEYHMIYAILCLAYDEATKKYYQLEEDGTLRDIRGK